MWTFEDAEGAAGVNDRVIGPVIVAVMNGDETAASVTVTGPPKLLSGPPESVTETVTSAAVELVVLTVVGAPAILKPPSGFPSP